MEENNKLKLDIVNLQDDLYISNYALDNIEKIIKAAITTNIKKTQKVITPAIVKIYREHLLVYRSIEQEIRDWHERTFINKKK